MHYYKPSTRNYWYTQPLLAEMVYLGLWGLSTQESLELKFKLHPDWGNFRLTGRKFQRNRTMKGKERWCKNYKLRLGILKASPLRIGGYITLDMYLMCAERRWEVRRQCTVEVTVRKLRPCTRRGIVQAASAVRLTVVLWGLGHVSSEQAVLHCSETSRSATALSDPVADRLRLRCGNQSGDKSWRSVFWKMRPITILILLWSFFMLSY